MAEIEIHREQDALLIIDLQPDFMPGGALPVAEGDAIVPGIRSILERFETVVATQDWHPRGHVSFASTHGRKPYESIQLYGHEQTLWPDHCVQGTPGAALHPDLPTEPITLVLRKGTRRHIDSYSAFRENFGPDGTRSPTGLAGWLHERRIQRVFLCGLARDFCVLWSAEDAAAAGFQTFLLDELTRPVFPDRIHETDTRLKQAGVQILRGVVL